MTDIIQLAEVDIQSTLGTITTNLKEVKVRIDEEFETLLDKKITAKDVAIAKKSVADARKIYKALEDKRKSIKKDWNKPYVEFETEYKETISSLTTYINNIKCQIDTIEQEEKLKKETEISDLIIQKIYEDSETASVIDNFVKKATWFKNLKWMNKSYTLKKIGEEIDIALGTIKQNLTILSQENEKIYPALLNKYEETGDISQALFLRDRLLKEEEERQAIKQKMEEQRRLEELARQQEVQEDLFTPNEVEVDNTPNEITPQEPPAEVQISNEVPEYNSIPLTNDTWNQPVKENTMPPKIDVNNITEDGKPVLAYTCEKDRTRINIGYSVTADVATIRYIKQMAEYYGAKFEVTDMPKAVEGE